MKEELLPYERRYVNEIMDILKSSEVKSSYREDAKEQLVEHIHEARLNNEDFKEILGTPEHFALHFMDTAVTREEQAVTKMNIKEAKHQSKRVFSLKGPLFFLVLTGIFYLVLQFSTVLIFTPVLAPGYGTAFHLFVISDFLWWNILVTAINVGIALVLSTVTMYLLSKRYRLF
ncbi:hypothetical protein J2S78_002818 [Salibacterium salarium]|uniref:Uncharacterized protein n=1 Tax=Salibacterium salarium TaxID=284579 RepID=A0A428MVC5_9BACI|nr:hypothetical protein [Salibacterium salarium]MDQ0300371.1 hypothetical protein [Salibacterium salarium]RSL30079.1 hypothetical protein D7Z54_27725 [Salibacterium salarium]